MNSKDNPIVSIIIPFYKNLVYLEECVKHCLELDYPSYENFGYFKFLNEVLQRKGQSSNHRRTRARS